MGNHAKIVPKKIKTGKTEVLLEEGDFLIECSPGKEDIYLENYQKDMPEACLVRIFKVENFDEKTSAIWQTSEAICIRKDEVLYAKFWGYDETLVLEKVMDAVLEKTAPDCFKKKRPVLGVIKKSKFGTTVSKS